MADRTIPAELWPHDGPAPKVEHVLSQVAGLLKDLGYTKTSSALQKEALKKTGLTKLEPADGLLALYSSSSAVAIASSDSDADSESSDADSDDSEDDSEKDEVEAMLVDVEAEERLDDSGDEDSSDSDAAAPKPAESSTKRKRAATPSSSGSGSSSGEEDSSSDDSDAPPAKRSKVADTTTGASDSDSASSDSSSASDSSDSDSDSSESAASDSSDSDSDSVSSSSSSSSSSSDDSSSESESDSEPAPPPVKVKKEKKKEKKDKTPAATIAPKVEPKDNGSQSSATLQGDSPEVEEAEDMSGIHPDRLKQSQFAPPATRKEGAASAKKAAVPFSRIPADQKVDPRFSNEYVSYDYADKAYQDLVVTKGKGFTKEKNKKKRGSYRGGAIDLAPKGIKFED